MLLNCPARVRILDVMLPIPLSMTVLAACAAPATPTVEVSSTTTRLIDCAETTPLPENWSILPTFEPDYPCELENVSKHVDFCMVHASPELSYPCSRYESVEETILSEGSQTRLIQRDDHVSGGCWHGMTSDTRSLKACDIESGVSVIVAEDVRGNLLPSPDGQWFAFIAWQPGNWGFDHVYRVRLDGSDLAQLDTQALPGVGITILQWSDDGQWLELSVWDGTEDGLHRYRLRGDGSGDYAVLRQPQ